jgi:hypothetical protein
MAKYRFILDAIIPRSQSNGNAWFDRPFDSAQDRLTTGGSTGPSTPVLEVRQIAGEPPVSRWLMSPLRQPGHHANDEEQNEQPFRAVPDEAKPSIAKAPAWIGPYNAGHDSRRNYPRLV